MPQLTEIQTIEAAGIPVTEYRTQPELGEQQLITIEFTPNVTDDEYLVKQPGFVFGDIVIIKQQWEHCFLNGLDTDGLDSFTISAMELVEPKNELGQIIDYPYWNYGIRCIDGTKEMTWFTQNELVRKASTTSDWF